MNIIKDFQAHGRSLKFFVRQDHCKEDSDVVNEVFTTDCYRLNLLNAKGFKPTVILDVGGHIGTFGIWAKTLWPDALLVALEPFEENFNLYKQNIELNGLKNAHVIRAAINYDPSRPVFQTIVGGATGGACFIPVCEAEQRAGNPKYILDYNIPTVTLEEVFEKYGIKAVNLAKFDCEGGEREAFRKMSAEALAKFQYIVGEFHSLGTMGHGFREKYMARFVNHDIVIPECDLPNDCGFFFAYPKVR